MTIIADTIDMVKNHPFGVLIGMTILLFAIMLNRYNALLYGKRAPYKSPTTKSRQKENSDE